MANAFFTKKAKAKMRERQRRKLKADGGGHGGDGGGGGGGGDSGDNLHDIRQAPPAAITKGQDKLGGGRKRSADQITSSSDLKSSQPSVIITVPADLAAKEAKKFRKDERRKARARGGQSEEDRLIFVVEGQEPPKDTHGDEASKGGKEGGDEKKQANKKHKSLFPRINDLLSQHAERKKLEEKQAKRKSSDDALPESEKEKYVAVDCEMVGVGIGGKKSALARASAVDWDGKVLFDTFVRVPERVTDFRTFVSGVRAKNIDSRNEEAMDHGEVRERLGKLLLGKVLVGHALKNDLAALMLTHPRDEIRDTARYKPFMRATGRSGGKLRPRKLRDLVHEELGKRIQVEGEAHCSIDDAQATMELFKSVRGRWEKELLAKKKGGGGRGKK